MICLGSGRNIVVNGGVGLLPVPFLEGFSGRALSHVGHG